MKQLQFAVFTVFITTTLLLFACSKNNTPVPGNGKPVNGDLLKSIHWANTGMEVYMYNTDSTLKRTEASGAGAATITRDFTYSNGKLSLINKSNLKKDSLVYNGLGQVIAIIEKQFGANNYGQKLQFTYNPNGTVKTLQYIEFDENGNRLVNTSEYFYNQQSQLVKIVSTDADQPTQKWIFTFEGYSEECYFNSFALIDPYELVFIDYQLYNYPVLSSIKALPKKTTIVFEENGIVKDTRTEEFAYTVTAKRLDKIVYKSNMFEVRFQY